MPWVLLMRAQEIQSFKGNQQAWQSKLYVYFGIYGESHLYWALWFLLHISGAPVYSFCFLLVQWFKYMY